MISRKRLSPLVALLIGAAVVLSGCGGTDPADTPAGPAAAPTATGPGDCGDVSAAVKDHLNSSDVDSVIVEGQCTTVVVATKLADEDVATARQLCETAGEVAYTDDVNAVSVVSASGEELSNGITGMKCLP